MSGLIVALCVAITFGQPTAFIGLPLGFGGDYVGQLGRNEGPIQYEPGQPIYEDDFRSSSVQSISVGPTHTLMTNGSLSVYAFGSNSHGQLGISRIYAAAWARPQAIDTGNVQMGTVAAGRYHSLFLSRFGGALYACGDNSWGQLGINDTSLEVSESLVRVETGGFTITVIAAGEYHNAAITSTKRVITWGRNDWAQLGDGTTMTSFIPIVVSNPAGAFAVNVAAGLCNTFVMSVTSQNIYATYAAGCNQYGQLGINSARTVLRYSVFTAIASPPSVQFGQIFPNVYETLAIANQLGQFRAYTWGSNHRGLLGNGQATNTIRLPAMVQFLNSSSLAPSSGFVSGGASFTNFYLVGGSTPTTRQIYSWGSNVNGGLGFGDETTQESYTPLKVFSTLRVTGMASSPGSGTHAFALQSPTATNSPSRTASQTPSSSPTPSITATPSPSPNTAIITNSRNLLWPGEASTLRMTINTVLNETATCQLALGGSATMFVHYSLAGTIVGGIVAVPAGSTFTDYTITCNSFAGTDRSLVISVVSCSSNVKYAGAVTTFGITLTPFKPSDSRTVTSTPSESNTPSQWSTPTASPM